MDEFPFLNVVDDSTTIERSESKGVAAGPGGLVVLEAVGNLDTIEGKRVGRTYAELEGVALPLAPVPDIRAVQTVLQAEFPHAREVISAILSDLTMRNHVRLRPTLLVGKPGSGKTWFCIRLLDELGVPHRMYPCGGNSDSGIAGNSRRWLTGEPSLPVSLFQEFQTASPGVVLDELEKVASGRTNGHLHDALIGMTEPSSASRWLDPYLEAEVDISRVIWLGTANTLDGVPRPLRDRFRILAFPDPGPAHLPMLANSLLRFEITSRGLDERWALPLDGVELEALSRHWPGGSLRKLSRLLDGILASRDFHGEFQ